jgi:hypothetical protein
MALLDYNSFRRMDRTTNEKQEEAGDNRREEMRHYVRNEEAAWHHPCDGLRYDHRRIHVASEILPMVRIGIDYGRMVKNA